MAYLRSGRSSALRRGVQFLPGGQVRAAGSLFALSATPTLSGLNLSTSPKQPTPPSDAVPDQIPGPVEASA